MLTNLTNLQWNHRTFFSFEGWQKCWHVGTSKYEPVVGNDDEMFGTAGYDLLLSQAAAVRQREDERETDVRGDAVLVLLSALNCTHPPPFISARSASTSSAPSIATSSCVGGNVKTNNLWDEQKTKQIRPLRHSLATVCSTIQVFCSCIISAALRFKLTEFERQLIVALPHFQGFQFNLWRAHHTSGCLSRSDSVRPCCRISWRACGRKKCDKQQEKRDRKQRRAVISFCAFWGFFLKKGHKQIRKLNESFLASNSE